MNRSSNDRLLVLVVFIFGLAAIGGSSYWLNEGSITIRQGQRGGSVAPANPNAPIAGQIAGDHFLFYPVCAVWELLGASMVILSNAGVYSRQCDFAATHRV
jgi:hypothetical protein